MIIYISNSKESIEKALKLINNLTLSVYTRPLFRNHLYMLATISNVLKINAILHLKTFRNKYNIGRIRPLYENL